MEALAGVKNGHETSVESGNETGVKNGNETASSTDKITKTIIVPVGIPGCGALLIFLFRTFCFLIFLFKIGKTSVSVALAHIFGFGHIQSDDVTVHAKKRAPVFIKNVVQLLRKHNAVIADKYVIYLFSHSHFFAHLFLR